MSAVRSPLEEYESYKKAVQEGQLTPTEKKHRAEDLLEILPANASEARRFCLFQIKRVEEISQSN